MSSDSAAAPVAKADEPKTSPVAKADDPKTSPVAKTDEPKAAPVAKTDEPKARIVLKAADGEEFEVDHAVAMEFKTVKSYFEDTSDNDDEHDPVVPLPNVKGQILAKIVEYTTKHVEFSAESASAADIKAYDDGFVKEESNEALKELILAANYLDHKGLLDLLNQSCADRIKNKSVKYVRAFFGVENDFTPEEEAQLRSENAWAFEGVDSD